MAMRWNRCAEAEKRPGSGVFRSSVEGPVTGHAANGCDDGGESRATDLGNGGRARGD